jgi:DNA repair protein RecN (Recombination protein N)
VLVELTVRNLGVIDEARLELDRGMNTLTGETGAGKTMVVDAIQLLLGARSDGGVVRPGADEAYVEGRFVLPPEHRRPELGLGEEIVLARAVPREGRSRAYIDGRLATAGVLVETGEALVDLHGQHAHQSLLGTGAQREALDRFGEVDLEALTAARTRVRKLEQEVALLGGDVQARAREIDLLRYQVQELDAAEVVDPEEDERLSEEEDVLADAAAHRMAAAEAVAALSVDGGAADPVGVAVAAVTGRSPFGEIEGRLRALASELTDVASELRDAADAIDENPQRLAELRERRQLLVELRRKYGETLADVMGEHRRLADRLVELEEADRRAAVVDDELGTARKQEAVAAAAVAGARRAAAPRLSREVEANLRELALPKARLEVAVEGPDPGDDVVFQLAANPGAPLQPLTKVASGGELARAMLALRLVLTAAPPTLVFDEVDAGVGGAAADAIGASLARLAGERQVLVVTHLPQVAAYADKHVTVTKQSDETTTVSTVRALDHEQRIVELSRMLSGQPDSETARRHAEELLARAGGR